MTALKPIMIENLNAYYGDNKVLNNINFFVDNNEVFGLVGLNGVGKTTLIKSIFGLVKNKGEAKLFGMSGKHANARKDVNYLPEKFIPSLSFKGIEYLSVLLSAYGENFDIKKAEIWCSRLDFDVSVLGQKISSYSKGMSQKLGLVGAFLTDSKLLILDEPMSGLDPLARVKLKECMREYVTSGGTIFFSSHIPSDVEEMCGRIGVIDKGHLKFVGKPNDFINEYKAKNLEYALLECSKK